MIEQKQQKRNAVASKSVQSFNEFTRSKNSKSSVKVKSENRGYSKFLAKASPVSKSAIDLTIETSQTPKAGITDPIIWQKAVEERQKAMEEKMDTFMSTMAIMVSKVTVAQAVTKATAAPLVTKATSVYEPSVSDPCSGAVLGVPVERSSVSEPSVGAPIIAAAALKEVVSAPPVPSITAQTVLPTVDESDPLPDGILTSDVGGGKSHHDASVDESGSVASSSSKRKRGKITSTKDNVAGSSQSSQSTPVTRSKRKLNVEEGGKEASKK